MELFSFPLMWKSIKFLENIESRRFLLRKLWYCTSEKVRKVSVLGQKDFLLKKIYSLTTLAI